MRSAEVFSLCFQAAHLAYCDADTELACVRLKRVRQEQRVVHLLIHDLPRDESDRPRFWQVPGDNVAEKMLERIYLCWKVVLVLCPALPRDPVPWSDS